MRQESRKKILVVDDDPTVRVLLNKRLQANYYDVVTASNGAEALRVYKDEKPDLIISDVEMPVMDGYSFILEFKEIADTQTTPVIMLTAKEQMRDIFKLEGINDYIVKPFRMNELLAKISRHLDDHNRKVLIVDEEEGFVDSLERRLTLSGYEVLKAYNGDSGLQMAKEAAPDVVLLDVMMPKVDGNNFCRLLKYDEAHKDILIIFTTAKHQEPDRDLGMEAGADACLTKPFEAEDLLQKIKELLWD